MLPDFLRPNRLKQIFGGMNPSPTFPSGPSMPEIPDETMYAQSGPEPMSMMGPEGYNPRREASDRLTTLIGQMPQREPASNMRKIGNLLVSLTQGPETAGKLFDAPHQQKLADWSNKLKPAEYEANLERQSNTQELTELRLSEIERKNREAADLARAKMTQAPELIDKRTAGAIELEGVKQPNRLELEGTRQTGRETLTETKAWTPFNLPDGTSVLVNPGTGEVKPLQLPEGSTGPLLKPGTGIKTKGGQTPEQLQGLQDKTREALSVIDRLIDEKGKIQPKALMAVGGSRLYGLVPNLPAGINSKVDEAKTADADIQTLKSRSIIGLIEEMKAQSRTGATGFGALNLKELGVLESEFADWNPNLPEKSFAEGLVRLRERLNKILQPGEGDEPVITVKPGSTLTPADVYKKYGG